MSVRVIIGDAREHLKLLPDQSVHCCVTSPPYFGLRDYGHAGQIGLEATPDAFVAEMVAVFREVRRVLRDDGTLWLNLGDSYASGEVGRHDQKAGYYLTRPAAADAKKGRGEARQQATLLTGLKPKNLLGTPWRVAFALQADGWYLRQDIIWSKPNPMPESVTDRCTKAHEYIFLMSKSARYFYDAEAIKEPVTESSIARVMQNDGNPVWNGDRTRSSTQSPQTIDITKMVPADGMRNKRSVWSVATQPFSEAHFATFPPALIEPCILAGTSERGCCPTCGAPWERVADKELVPTAKAAKTFIVDGRDEAADKNDQGSNRQKDGHRPGWINRTTTLGWRPTCACPEHKPIPCTVLDPFAGAGTTGLVADRLQRNAILIELNPEYAAMARRRIHGDAPLFASVAEDIL